MKTSFLKDLLRLYPDFIAILGPYENKKTKRKHVILKHKSGRKIDRRGLSWPKALLEVKIGRCLIGDETCDHVDEDFTNDEWKNLEIKTRAENARKTMLRPERMAKIERFICPQCAKSFAKELRVVRHNQFRQGKAGPFCSKSCAGIYATDIQNERA